ncbi:hypothetical protein [Nonomuraea sp. NPDC050310]|uniref:hypothetical protein n=1 Tax=Nonomuraea sp. NPDC050310 TaxID=3154935 RepID=UPI0033D7D3A5
MTFLGTIRLTGAPALAELTAALEAAAESGWEAPGGVIRIRDHRVLGHPAGATVELVLAGQHLELDQAAVALAALGRHLLSQSPGLPACTISALEITTHAGIGRPRRSLPSLLDEELLALSAQYLLAAAAHSLRRRAATPAVTADDVVAAAADHPWARELTAALGPLLISAARLEATTQARANLTAGGGDTALAEELLRRARATAVTHAAEDSAAQGRRLVEDFVRDHDLRWNPDVPPSGPDELLWPGIRALATLTSSLSGAASPWTLLTRLTDDELVSELAEREAERVEMSLDGDGEEVAGAALAHAAVWLAIQRPDLLDTPDGERLVSGLAEDIAPFHHLAYSALLMAGAAPVTAAIEATDAQATFKEVTQALGLEQPDSDAYNALHHALETVLQLGEDLPARLRQLLTIITLSADLTATELNPRRGQGGYVSSPAELAAALLRHPSEYAALILFDGLSSDARLRLHALATTAALDPSAAGSMAATLPDLTGDAPHTEPTARARRWVETALLTWDGPLPDLDDAPDAGVILNAVSAGAAVPTDWPLRRVVAASAQAAALLAHAAGRTDLLREIFTAA